MFKKKTSKLQEMLGQIKAGQHPQLSASYEQKVSAVSGIHTRRVLAVTSPSTFTIATPIEQLSLVKIASTALPATASPSTASPSDQAALTKKLAQKLTNREVQIVVTEITTEAIVGEVTLKDDANKKGITRGR